MLVINVFRNADLSFAPPQCQSQQPCAGSLTSSNSSSSGGSSSDGDDVNETTLHQDQQLAMSRSSLMARRWGQASSAFVVGEVEEQGEEQSDDSPSKPRPQALYVMNKARDLCARIRHQAKVKQREERKRILLQRYVNVWAALSHTSPLRTPIVATKTNLYFSLIHFLFKTFLK